MARIRTIKPEFWLNEDLATCSEAANLLAIGLLNYADDDGYFNANPALIKAVVFPLREPSRTIPVLLRELYSIGYVEFYSGKDNKLYGHVVNFSHHQVINKKKPSNIKQMIAVRYEYGIDTVVLPSGMEWKGMEKKEKQEKEKKNFRADAEVVIDFINKVTFRRYRKVDANLKPIIAVLASGVTVQDCKTVIARVNRKWKDDPKMRDYIRIKTIFAKSNFESYLAECTPIEA